VPRLPGAAFGEARAEDNGLLIASWTMGDGCRLHLLANPSAAEIKPPAMPVKGTPIWGEDANDPLKPWSVVFLLEQPA